MSKPMISEVSVFASVAMAPWFGVMAGKTKRWYWFCLVVINCLANAAIQWWCLR